MRLTKGQLKRIIREEYSRLKRQGLIRESYDEEPTGSWEDDANAEMEFQTAYKEGEKCSRSGGSPEDCPWDYQDTELEDAWMQGFHEGHPDNDDIAEYQDSDAYRQKEMFRSMRRR